MNDTYQTISKPTVGEFKDRGSKFIAYSFAAYSTDQIKDHLEYVRKEHPKARHHCYAWRLGLDKNNFRANDDGEPSGTAGKPILGQIDSFGLTNVLVVVIRYFGGTKLGVSGLINAYRTAAKDAFDQAKIIEKQVMELYKVRFNYASMGQVMSYLKKRNFNLLEQNFDEEPEVLIEVRLNESEAAFKELNEFPGIRASKVTNS